MVRRDAVNLAIGDRHIQSEAGLLQPDSARQVDVRGNPISGSPRLACCAACCGGAFVGPDRLRRDLTAAVTRPWCTRSLNTLGLWTPSRRMSACAAAARYDVFGGAHHARRRHSPSLLTANNRQCSCAAANAHVAVTPAAARLSMATQSAGGPPASAQTAQSFRARQRRGTGSPGSDITTAAILGYLRLFHRQVRRATDGRLPWGRPRRARPGTSRHLAEQSEARGTERDSRPALVQRLSQRLRRPRAWRRWTSGRRRRSAIRRIPYVRSGPTAWPRTARAPTGKTPRSVWSSRRYRQPVGRLGMTLRRSSWNPARTLAVVRPQFIVCMSACRQPGELAAIGERRVFDAGELENCRPVLGIRSA